MNGSFSFHRRTVVGNKQLSDSFKVLEQRQKSLSVSRALPEGRTNRSMQDLVSSCGQTASDEEEDGAIIVFFVGGMTYSEIRSGHALALHTS